MPIETVPIKIAGVRLSQWIHLSKLTLNRKIKKPLKTSAIPADTYSTPLDKKYIKFNNLQISTSTNVI